MRTALVVLVLVALLGGGVFLTLRGEPAPSTAAPRATRNAEPAAAVADSERKPLELPAAVDAGTADTLGVTDGGEDVPVRAPGDEAFARKYAHRTHEELEAAFDELGQAWHEARGAAIDAALSGGNFATHIVAPADLDAKLRELTEAAKQSGDLFSSRTVPYGQGVMLELQFVRIGRTAYPQLFAQADEVRWLERELERTRHDEDDER
jgi:hypothetical protein